ncbi:hypothetical protein LCGC14_1146060 [marine sediment metagenome]|uniref:Uncharacterized protein n=1 Tax=marine sediment metagenome TaxID=412755 RepID=A0A0F9M1P3_9ZZZZ
MRIQMTLRIVGGNSEILIRCDRSFVPAAH